MTHCYDTHAHLDFPDFADDLPQVMERARGAGVIKIITVGTSLASSARAIQLCEQFPDLYAVVGCHPSDVLTAPEDLRPELRRLASHPKVVAVGETGLDYHRLPSQLPGGTAAEDRRYTERQRQLFQQHLEVAAEFGLNCVIHQRDALDDLLAIFQPFTPRVRGVFHCFVDDARAAQRIQDLDSLVSFTGIVTFKNAEKVRETAAAIPLGRFLLETDCPYLAPVPHRGQRCEPAYIREVAQTMALVKHCSLAELSAATCAAAGEFFRGLGAIKSIAERGAVVA